MADSIDVYSDQFQVNVGPFGCTLNFQLTGSAPVLPGTPPKVETQASVRVSMELLKAMAFLLHRQVVAYESQTKTSVDLPVQVLQGMQIRQEDWQAFWRP